MPLGSPASRAYADGRVSAPEVSQVAGFSTWRALGRSVEKGQEGYEVLAPVRYAQPVAVDGEGRARTLLEAPKMPAVGRIFCVPSRPRDAPEFARQQQERLGSGDDVVKRLRDTLVEHRKDLFQVPAGKDQLAECCVVSFAGAPPLDKYERLMVSLVTQDVK